MLIDYTTCKKWIKMKQFETNVLSFFIPKNYLGIFWSFSRAQKLAIEALIMFVKNIKKA